MGSGARPVAIRLGALGDMVMFLPTLEAIARRWGTPVDVITSGAWSPYILSHSPVLGELLVLKGTRRRPYWLSLDKQRAARWLRARPEAPILDFERKAKMDDIFRGGRVDPQRIATVRDLPPRPVHQIDTELALAHQAFAALVSPSLPQPEEGMPKLDSARTDTRRLEQWLAQQGLTGKPLVLLQPGNKRTMRRRPAQRASNRKYWPVERWSAVAARIAEELPDAAVLICGVPNEAPLARAIADQAGVAAVRSMAGELPLERLVALCTRAHSMVSVDTGPAHVAAAAGCPLVVLYGSTDPRTFAPRGPGPVTCLTPPDAAAADREHFPLLHLSPEMVVEAWRSSFPTP